MRTYRTSEVAKLIGIHPNTVRLYETLQLIPKPQRLPNGYRVFTNFHLVQLRLIRTAFEIEVIHNGLRKKMIEAVKASAQGNFDHALSLVSRYIKQLIEEQNNARQAAEIVSHRFDGNSLQNGQFLKRKDAAINLGVSMDCLRNWEMNGLIQVKRKENGYRVYSDSDFQRLKIIRTLRCSGYSLEAILRMLTELDENPDANVQRTLDIPREEDDIISVCDRLMTSLNNAQENAQTMIRMLNQMKQQFS